MASVVQIAKFALSHLGDRWEISSLTEESAEARQCNLHYETSRDAALRDMAPNWAVSYTEGTSLSGTVPGLWLYMYAYPSNCLRLIEIVNPLGKNVEPIPFEVANVGGIRVILTNQAEAELRFVVRVTDPNVFDPLFIKALSFRLAADIAIPLGASKEQPKMEQNYWIAIGRAGVISANEGVSNTRPESEFMQARQ